MFQSLDLAIIFLCNTVKPPLQIQLILAEFQNCQNESSTEVQLEFILKPIWVYNKQPKAT
jgi:hypothetical protein